MTCVCSHSIHRGALQLSGFLRSSLGLCNTCCSRGPWRASPVNGRRRWKLHGCIANLSWTPRWSGRPLRPLQLCLLHLQMGLGSFTLSRGLAPGALHAGIHRHACAWCASYKNTSRCRRRSATRAVLADERARLNASPVCARPSPLLNSKSNAAYSLPEARGGAILR